MALTNKKTTLKNSKSSPNIHPPYFQMITEAVTSLKDRNGSSQLAIAKFIEAKYKDFLPPNFKKILSVQLKMSAIQKSYSRVKKLSQKKKEIKNLTPKTTSKKKVEKVARMKTLSQVKTPEALKKNASATSAAGKTSGKMKRLSQVKTPEMLKKTKAVTIKNHKSLRSPTSAPKKGKYDVR